MGGYALLLTPQLFHVTSFRFSFQVGFGHSPCLVAFSSTCGYYHGSCHSLLCQLLFYEGACFSFLFQDFDQHLALVVHWLAASLVSSWLCSFFSCLIFPLSSSRGIALWLLWESTHFFLLLWCKDLGVGLSLVPFSRVSNCKLNLTSSPLFLQFHGVNSGPQKSLQKNTLSRDLNKRYS